MRGKQYAHTYAQQLQDLLLATQLRVLRKQRKLSQQGLAHRAKMKQARISLLEGGTYSRWSVATLRALAEALDVGLDVRFVNYFDLVDRLEQESMSSLLVERRATQIADTTHSTVSKSPTRIERAKVSAGFQLPASLNIDWTAASNTAH